MNNARKIVVGGGIDIVSLGVGCLRTLKRISEMQMLIFVSAPNGPEGAEWVNYQNSPRPKDKLREDDGKWKGIPASMETFFGKTYLTEDDWKISI